VASATAAEAREPKTIFFMSNSLIQPFRDAAVRSMEAKRKIDGGEKRRAGVAAPRRSEPSSLAGDYFCRPR
jgi:hypothetical protein